MKRFPFFLASLLLFFYMATEAQGVPDEGKWQLSGHIKGLSRLYTDNLGDNDYASLQIEPEWTWRNKTGGFFTFRPRLLLEAKGSGGELGEIQELNWLTPVGPGTLRIGISRVSWGVVESRHLIDIVNPSDYARDYTGETRIGIPMLHLVFPASLGQIELLFLPWEFDPDFPGINGRPRTLLPVSDDLLYPDGKPDALVSRVSFSVADLDAHLYYFRGIDRETTLSPIFDSVGFPTALVASRFLISQWGIDFQIPRDNWLIKGEGLYRTGYSDPFVAGVIGVEYTLNSIGGSVQDLSILSEYQWDDGRPADAPLPLLKNGIFLGSRLSRNDPAGTEIKAGVVWDIDSSAYLPRFTFYRRLGQQWTIETNFNGFVNVKRSPTLQGFVHDSYIELLFKYHFLSNQEVNQFESSRDFMEKNTPDSFHIGRD